MVFVQVLKTKGLHTGEQPNRNYFPSPESIIAYNSTVNHRMLACWLPSILLYQPAEAFSKLSLSLSTILLFFSTCCCYTMAVLHAKSTDWAHEEATTAVVLSARFKSYARSVRSSVGDEPAAEQQLKTIRAGTTCRRRCNISFQAITWWLHPVYKNIYQYTISA